MLLSLARFLLQYLQYHLQNHYFTQGNQNILQLHIARKIITAAKKIGGQVKLNVKV